MPYNPLPNSTRRFDPFLAALLVVFAFLALTYSLFIPLFEGPDEDDHFRYAKYLADHRALPVQLFQQGGGEAGHQGWQPPFYYALAAMVIAPIDTRDYETHLWRNPAQSFVGDIACCGRNLYFHLAQEFPYRNTTLAVHLARGVTILFGLVCVYAFYALALTLFPAQNYLALAVTAFATLNPTFLFASALVSNDIPLVAFCALAFLVTAKILTRQWNANWKSFALLGVLVGFAILTKTTALGLLPITFASIIYLSWNHRAGSPISLVSFVTSISFAILISLALAFLAPLAILTAWYFARNQIFYGDPLAYQLVAASALPPRDAPLTFAELTQINLPWLWQTFWGGPTPGDFPQILLNLSLAAFVLALVGFALYIFHARRALGADRLVMLGLLLAWLAFIFAAQLQFIRTAGGTDQGRYLFPAIFSLALVFVLGWNEIIFRLLHLRANSDDTMRADLHSAQFLAAQRFVAILLTAFFIALPLFVFAAYTVPAFAAPAPFNPAQLELRGTPLDANFENGMSLRGVSIAARAVACGETLNVTLFWTTDARMTETYRVFAHLVDERGAVAGGKDVIPGRGAYPTVYWKPGEWLQDTISVPLARGARAGNYNVMVGAYKFGEPEQRVNLKNSEQDFVSVGNVQVNAPPEGCP